MNREGDRHSGSYIAYQPEYLSGDEWKSIPIETSRAGIPPPAIHGGISALVDLYGKHQALALAHTFAAYQAANGHMSVEVRAYPYRVNFEVKVSAIPEAAPL